MGAENVKNDIKGWFLSGFVIAVLYLGLDMFFQNYFLSKIYQSHAQFFRSPALVLSNRWWGYLGYLAFGLLFSCLYIQGFEEEKSNPGQGFRFGLLIGLFYWLSHLLISYPHLAIPTEVYLSWFGIGLFEFTLLGFILGLYYKPREA